MVRRKIASHPPARGQTLIAETVNKPEVLRSSEQYFAGTDLSGPVSLELKRDARGNFWAVEPTVGRTEFWVQLRISAGFNQPLLEHQLARQLQRALPCDAQREVVWYDTERDPLAFVSHCWRERQLRPRSRQHVFPYYGHGDWRPIRQALGRLVRNRARRLCPGRTTRPEVATDSAGEPT